MARLPRIVDVVNKGLGIKPKKGMNNIKRMAQPLVKNYRGIAWMSITAKEADKIGIDSTKLSGREVIRELRTRLCIPQRTFPKYKGKKPMTIAQFRKKYGKKK